MAQFETQKPVDAGISYLTRDAQHQCGIIFIFPSIGGFPKEDLSVDYFCVFCFFFIHIWRESHRFFTVKVSNLTMSIRHVGSEVILRAIPM